MRKFRIRPRTLKVPGSMNRLELGYSQRLELLLRAGEIRSYRFEALKLRLADKTFYTPDFYVVTENEIQLHEVKGFWEDDARVKIKVAAFEYPEFQFIAVRKIKKEWEFEKF